MKGLIIGTGEVGKSLFNVLKSSHYFTNAADIHSEPAMKGSVDILHVCFPYSEGFIGQVEFYQTLYKPKYTIIHSTIPVGTSNKLSAIHSPIRGLHPNLEGGIKTFVKFIGGEKASEVADYFRKAGMKVMLFDKAETTEAMKLFDTEYFRACIEFAQKVKAYCDEHDLNFHEVYTLANTTYNEGYTILGHSEFVRPVLQPIMGPIGGHCVMPNKALLELSYSRPHGSGATGTEKPVE